MSDIIVYGDDLPNPDLDTEGWHTMAQTIYILLVGGPWEDLERNARASLKENPENTEVVELAGLLATLQEMIFEEYKEDGDALGELEKIRNLVSSKGPLGTLQIYW